MKKSKYLLIAMLLMIPTLVFASSGSDNGIPITFAIVMEAFVSIHMSLFVLKPLSDILSPDSSKKLFWILFGIRAGILLFCDFFITTGIVIVDFVAVFFGAFLVVPITAAITKKPIHIFKRKTINSNMNVKAQMIPQTTAAILKCTKCGGILQPTDKFCQKCGATFENNTVQAVQDSSPLVQMDQKYLFSAKAILKNTVIEEIKSQGENEKTLSTQSLNNKKNILLAILGIATFIFVLMFYFNYSLILCGFLEIISLIIYLIIFKRFNIINVITKEAIKNPNEDISNITKRIREQKKDTFLPNIAKVIIMLLVLIIIPSLIFITPKILYQKVGNGYYVLRYTRGIISKAENEIIIPNSYKGKPVIGIQENAFKNSNISKVTLPNELQSIKTKAFYNCKNIKEITIPKKVTEIRASAFENDTNLITVNLSEGITEIRASAFKNCTNLIDIDLPNSLEYLGASVFSNCRSLVEITIPEKVTEINGQAFEYCTSLKAITLHDNITSIHGETFVGDINLNNVVLPSKITEIRGNTFEGCTSLTSIIIPEGVIRIGGHAFYGCSKLSEVYIPSTVVEIGSSAFRQCYSLYSVIVPSGIYINERAFKESPTSVYYSDEMNSINDSNKENKSNEINKYLTNYESDYISLGQYSADKYVELKSMKLRYVSRVYNDNSAIHVSGDVSNYLYYKGSIVYKIEYYDMDYNLIGTCNDTIELSGVENTGFACQIEIDQLSKPVSDLVYYKIFIPEVNING